MPVLIKSSDILSGKSDCFIIRLISVGIMFKGAGYDVIGVGVDVSADKFLEVAKESNVNLIGLSALSTTALGNIRTIIDQV